MIRTILGVAGLVVLCAGAAHAAPILDFEDVPNPTGSDVFLTSYSGQGFTLSSASGFFAHGSNTGLFFMGSQALAAFVNETIVLSRDGGLAFSVTSIDLARNFAFDPAPSVTFTGTKAGGGTVTQTFTVTTAAGVQAFQTFQFVGFDNLLSLQWVQPTIALGLHQFDDIALDVPAAVPEPASMVLLGLGLAGVAARRWRLRHNC